MRELARSNHREPPLTATDLVDGFDRGAAGRDVFTIRDLTKEFGVSARTLRFYEEKGLVDPRRNGEQRDEQKCRNTKAEMTVGAGSDAQAAASFLGFGSFALGALHLFEPAGRPYCLSPTVSVGVQFLPHVGFTYAFA